MSRDDARCARDGTDQSVGKGALRADDPDLFETIEKAARIAQHLVQGAQPRGDLRDRLGKMIASLVRNVAGKPAGLDQVRRGNDAARPHSSAAAGPLR